MISFKILFNAWPMCRWPFAYGGPSWMLKFLTAFWRFFSFFHKPCALRTMILVFVVHFVGDFRALGNLSLGVKVSLCSPFFTLILKFANFTPVLVKSH